MKVGDLVEYNIPRFMIDEGIGNFDIFDPGIGIVTEINERLEKYTVYWLSRNSFTMMDFYDLRKINP